MSLNKKLYRSAKDRKISGLCGGLAEYFNIDATILRLIVLVLIITTGVFPGLIGYIVGAMVTPVEGDSDAKKE